MDLLRLLTDGCSGDDVRVVAAVNIHLIDNGYSKKPYVALTLSGLSLRTRRQLLASELMQVGLKQIPNQMPY